MRSGQLDKRITLRRAVPGANRFTEPEFTWVDLATLWAAVRWVSDGERFSAGEMAARISHRFTIRRGAGWADLNPKDRVQYRGAEYDIIGVKELPGDFLEITASARADQ